MGDAGNCEEGDSFSGKSGDLEQIAEVRGSVKVLSVAGDTLRHGEETVVRLLKAREGARMEVH